MKDYIDILQEQFGYSEFREHQVEVIDAILKDKRDVFINAFTGYGKSLCFQFPPVYTNKVSIIISPLISLMNDQMMKMEKLNITVCCLNSTVKNKNQLKEDILLNDYRLVYMTPEYLITQESFLRDLDDTDQLLSFNVDESHIVSNWGNDFRPSYRQLNCLKNWFPHIPIVALTASSTPRVQADIIKSLRLIDPLIIKTTFDRENLSIMVDQKSSDPMDDIIPLIADNEPTIIYCQTRKITDDIATQLTLNGIDCASYHAGVDTANREEIHTNFINGIINVIVATVAFGMGIDHASIRKVIHYGIPKDIESYYQEIGRAGRDMKPSKTYLLYSLNDNATNDFFINQIEDQTYRTHRLEMATSMKNYIFSSECRKKYILAYFGEEYKRTDCNCDNCTTQLQTETFDFTDDAIALLSTINDTDNRYGLSMIITILQGSGSKKVKKYTGLKFFGKGKHRSDQFWKIFTRMLINLKYIKENTHTHGYGLTLSRTRAGDEWIKQMNNKNAPKLILPMPKQMIDITPKAKPIQIAIPPPPKINIETYKMYTEEKTIQEIAKNKDCKEITIENQLIAIYELNHASYPIDPKKFGLTDTTYNLISGKIKQLNYPDRLRVIKNALPNQISYMQIRLAQVRMNRGEIAYKIPEDDRLDDDIIKRPTLQDYLPLPKKILKIPDESEIIVYPKKVRKVQQDDDFNMQDDILLNKKYDDMINRLTHQRSKDAIYNNHLMAEYKNLMMLE